MKKNNIEKKVKRVRKVLLVLNKESSPDIRVLVNLHTRWLEERVGHLLREAKDKEAFELIVNRAQVERYLTPGQRPEKRPDLTFIEDMI